jgi:lipoate---protein ligase
MRLLDLTLPTPAENLALDEALLEEAETSAHPPETLRFWEPSDWMVVVGRSSRIDDEVHRDACREMGIPILRRVSGGAAILTGPGCLMYSLVLNCEIRPHLRAIGQAHSFILGTLAQALVPSVYEVCCQGISDLTYGKGDRSNSVKGTGPICAEHPPGRSGKSDLSPSPRPVPFSINDRYKFSGNSMRHKHRRLLYHGTILYDFSLDMISCCLKMPPRMPDYRASRPHKTFLKNLPLSAAEIRRAIRNAWNAVEPCGDWPRELTSRLAAEKYSNPQWKE